MSNRQSSHTQIEPPVPADAENTNPSDRKSPPRDYYYDDSTGYEIYEDPDEEDEDLDGKRCLREQSPVARAAARS